MGKQSKKTYKETEFAPVTENNLLDGNRIVNVQEIMRQLLQGCSDCGSELKLTRLISETKSGLGSYFYISCECGVINTICSGKRHPDVNTDKIQHRKVFLYQHEDCTWCVKLFILWPEHCLHRKK